MKLIHIDTGGVQGLRRFRTDVAGYERLDAVIGKHLSRLNAGPLGETPAVCIVKECVRL
jgi:hypothetical protein